MHILAAQIDFDESGSESMMLDSLEDMIGFVDLSCMMNLVCLVIAWQARFAFSGRYEFFNKADFVGNELSFDLRQ